MRTARQYGVGKTVLNRNIFYGKQNVEIVYANLYCSAKNTTLAENNAPVLFGFLPTRRDCNKKTALNGTNGQFLDISRSIAR